MSKTDKGGPAFPHTVEYKGADCGGIVPHGGMTMLDYFAAKAMQGELSAMTASDWASFAGLSLEISDGELDRLAQHWFRIGRAMLKAREQ